MPHSFAARAAVVGNCTASSGFSDEASATGAAKELGDRVGLGDDLEDPQLDVTSTAKTQVVQQGTLSPRSPRALPALAQAERARHRPAVRQVLALVATAALACQPEGMGSFTTVPTTPPSSSTSDAADHSSSAPPWATSTTNGDALSTGPQPTSSDSAATSSSGPVFDMGIKDLGDAKPEGCKGKIDFLFVISRDLVMKSNQEKLIAAFPKFMETVEAKFSDFDFHVMAIDGDTGWGHIYCNDDCPVIDCKVGDPCCPGWACPNCNPPINVGDPCCPVPDYPCAFMDQVTACEWTIGAGNVFAAGVGAPNLPCKMPAERRYLVSGDPNVASTFACMAQVGLSGSGRLGQAMTAALYPEINGPGGCNEGFLRKDALLMVTFIGSYDEDSDSKGDPASWAGTVLGVKGDPGAVVFLEILNPECPFPEDRICEFIKMFPYHMVGDSSAASYAPIFDAATDLVATACAEYVPQ